MSGWDTRSRQVQPAPRRAPARSRGGPRIGPLRITPVRALVVVAFVGAIAYIGWAIIRVRDATQIPMLSSGFAILGLACVAVAIGALMGLWRAAARAQMGRAVGLALGGGLFGLAAIGCFTATVVFAMLWRS